MNLYLSYLNGNNRKYAFRDCKQLKKKKMKPSTGKGEEKYGKNSTIW